eukprot:GHVN01105441.1.p1 GENE.GHVN01105441.1~~GHVN01105441.1.p1  ORF type:complete len:588 (-),score=44.69 GHVN01105441.1:13-1776(-)
MEDSLLKCDDSSPPEFNRSMFSRAQDGSFRTRGVMKGTSVKPLSTTDRSVVTFSPDECGWSTIRPPPSDFSSLQSDTDSPRAASSHGDQIKQANIVGAVNDIEKQSDVQSGQPLPRQREAAGERDGSNNHNMLDSVEAGAFLALSAAGLLVSSIGNSLYFKKMTSAMPNYGWFLSQVTSFAYVPVFGVVVLATHISGRLSDENRQFPKRRFALIGFLDSLAGVCLFLGGVHTDGTTQVVLQQMSIPLCLALSIVLLGVRYHFLQYCGSVLMLVGVLVTQWAGLTGHDPSHGGASNIPAFNGLFLFAAAPTALSTVYKETAFRSTPLDVNFLQFWVAVFQLAGGFAVAPLNSLKLLGSQRRSLRECGKTLITGSKCLFLGINTITENCGGHGQPPCDNCHSAWIPIVIYLTFNVLYNLALVAVIKHGGATMSFLVSTLRLPLASLAFCSTLLMGSEASSLKVTDIIGLIMLIVGLMVYRYGGFSQRKSIEGEETCEMLFFNPLVEAEPHFVAVHTAPKLTGRSAEQVRSKYYWRLAVETPRFHNTPRHEPAPLSLDAVSPLRRPLLDQAAVDGNESAMVVVKSFSLSV